MVRWLSVIHECNCYCKNSEHCDIVFTGDTELYLAAPRIAQILSNDHGVKVIKVQPAMQPATEATSTSDRGGWWLTWWLESKPARVA